MGPAQRVPQAQREQERERDVPPTVAWELPAQLPAAPERAALPETLRPGRPQVLVSPYTSRRTARST
jgi:hypothetical protein